MNLGALGAAAMALLLFRIAEEKGDAPDTGKRHQGIDDPTQHSKLTAEEKGNTVKAENADAAPVERTDDRKRQCDLIKDHLKTSYETNTGFMAIISARTAFYSLCCNIENFTLYCPWLSMRMEYFAEYGGALP